MKYVSLHHHSTYSFMDGFGTPKHHVDRAAELGMTALALTEHGNVSSHPQLEKAALKAGIKPIFGLEAYTALDPKDQRKFHLTLLAMNQAGYANLMSIVTKSWEDFHYYPTVLGRTLAEHHEGLIVLSGCADSLLACSLLGGKTIDARDASYERARRQALAFKGLLGDRFYLETQMFPELSRAHNINQAYERLSTETGIRLAATQDVHYPQPNDNEMQVVLHAAGRGAGSVAAQEAGWEYDIKLTHPFDDQMAYDRLLGTGLSRRATVSALRATAEIAERCGVTLPKAERLRYPSDTSALDLVWAWLREGWAYRVKHGNRRMLKHQAEYVERIHHEMKSIVAKDFLDYFLMTSDIVRFAKDSGIPVGPARGSAAGSLVCYLLRITEIDPMEYPLMNFERFIAPDRDDIPDIDLDFDDERRAEVREYATRKYGEDRVGNVANYVKYKGKNALVDVARVFPLIPKGDVHTVKSMVIERSGGDSRADFGLVDTAEMFPAAKAIFEKHKDLKKAMRLEGNYRGMSVNAAGFIIANQPLNQICAQYTREVAGELRRVVSVDKKDAEYLNLMKVDFLSLSTMGMIRIALGLAGLTLDDLYAVPMTDPETLEAFQRNDVIGIFQYEGRATRLVNREVAPDHFLELSDINGLSRPGPLFSGATADYIDVKHGKKQVEKVHPIWDSLTVPTKGQVIYQEQVLAALGQIGGIPPAKVGEIRKIISQKLGEMNFARSMKDFVEGAARLHGIDRKTAEFMWGRLVTSATYSFNMAHCISYAMLGFWCMWLKIHHPAAFYCAALIKAKEESATKAVGNTGITKLIKDAQQHGVPVRGVDPAHSDLSWRIIQLDADLFEPSIIAGWTSIDGIGPSIAKRIIEYRDHHMPGGSRWPMTLADLASVKGIGPKIMGKIEAIDAEDPFRLQRIRDVLSGVRQGISEGDLPLPRPTHTSDEVLDAKGGQRVVWIGLVKLKEYKDFVEDERARTGDDPEDIKARMKWPDRPTSVVLHCYDDGDEDVYVRIHRSVYPSFREDVEAIDPQQHVILVVGKKSSNSFGASVYADKLYFFDAEETDDE